MGKEIRSVGLKSIKMGAIAADGGMGAELEAVGVTSKGTASFVVEKGTTTDFFSEENVLPEESISEPGTASLKYSLINLEPEALKKVLGGEVTGAADAKRWDAPSDVVNIEASLQVETLFGVLIDIPRAKLSAVINWNLSRTEIAKIDVEAKVLNPAKEGVAPYSIYKKQAVAPEGNGE